MKKPNIVYIFCDQLRRQAIGYMGEDPVITPNLDDFASESVVFNQAVSNYPVCSPYRGILLTGMYPHKNHITTNCTSKSAVDGCYLHDDQVCLSDILAQNNYDLGYIGKWHLDAPKEEDSEYTEGMRGDGRIWDAYTPPGRKRHGFNFWYAYGCYDWHMTPHYWVNEAKIDERIDVKEWSVRHEAQVAIDYITNPQGTIRDEEKPFALFVSFNPPHTGFKMFPQEYLAYYEGKTAEDLLVRANVQTIPEAVEDVKNYFSAITGIDENFGQMMKALKEKGIEKDTIVIFTSDHGEMMGSHGLMHKNIWYEEATGVPFIVRYPETFQHQQVEAQLSTIDIMPTLLGAVGLGECIPEACIGHDFSTNMKTKDYADAPEASLYYVQDEKSTGNGRGVRDARYTFILSEQEGKQRCILYDREKDPYQLTNIADEQADLVALYLEKLEKMLAEIEDEFQVQINRKNGE